MLMSVYKLKRMDKLIIAQAKEPCIRSPTPARPGGHDHEAELSHKLSYFSSFPPTEDVP